MASSTPRGSLPPRGPDTPYTEMQRGAGIGGQGYWVFYPDTSPSAPALVHTPENGPVEESTDAPHTGQEHFNPKYETKTQQKQVRYFMVLVSDIPSWITTSISKAMWESVQGPALQQLLEWTGGSGSSAKVPEPTYYGLILFLRSDRPLPSNNTFHLFRSYLWMGMDIRNRLLWAEEQRFDQIHYFGAAMSRWVKCKVDRAQELARVGVHVAIAKDSATVLTAMELEMMRPIIDIAVVVALHQNNRDFVVQGITPAEYKRVRVALDQLKTTVHPAWLLDFVAGEKLEDGLSWSAVQG